MMIFNQGERLYPLVNYTSLRVYSKVGFGSLFANDGSTSSFELKERIAAFNPPTDVSLASPEYPVINRILRDHGSNVGLASCVMSRDSLFNEGRRCTDAETSLIANNLSGLLRKHLGFGYFIDYLDNKPVLVVLGYPAAFVGF